MGAYYDEIEIEDMTWDPDKRVYYHPCPCGDRFEISKKQLANYEDIAICPSCSLVVRIVYDPLDYEDYEEEDEGDPESSEEEDEEDDTDTVGESDDSDDVFEDALEDFPLGVESNKIWEASMAVSVTA